MNLLQDRTLHLYNTISNASVAPLLAEIIRINNEDEKVNEGLGIYSPAYIPDSQRKPIHLHINCGGGIIYDCFSLLSAMNSSRTPIYTYTQGYVMSSGLTLFLGGTKRFAGKYATFMLHDPTEDLGKDKLFVVENRIEETKRIKDIRNKYICERTKLTQSDLDEHKHIDWFMSAEEAIKYGVFHEII